MFVFFNYSCSYIFKLADFGTARKLAPEEKFTSLHGTEEYLVCDIRLYNCTSIKYSLHNFTTCILVHCVMYTMYIHM